MKTPLLGKTQLKENLK